jgi:hypothetical protein
MLPPSSIWTGVVADGDTALAREPEERRVPVAVIGPRVMQILSFANGAPASEIT